MAESCRFAFAVHVLTLLGTAQGGPCASATLAHAVNTHPVVIRRLLVDLQHGGLIVTERGVRGGARLSRAPRLIRLGHVYAIIDNPRVFGRHANPPLQSCAIGCRIEEVLNSLRERCMQALVKELNKVTLADVIAEIRD